MPWERILVVISKSEAGDVSWLKHRPLSDERVIRKRRTRLVCLFTHRPVVRGVFGDVVLSSCMPGTDQLSQMQLAE